jgi:hypothetical protein
MSILVRLPVTSLEFQGSLPDISSDVTGSLTGHWWFFLVGSECERLTRLMNQPLEFYCICCMYIHVASWSLEVSKKNWVQHSIATLLSEPNTRAHSGMGFALVPQAWLFYSFSKSNSLILLKKQPETAGQRSTYIESFSLTQKLSGPTQSYCHSQVLT